MFLPGRLVLPALHTGLHTQSWPRARELQCCSPAWPWAEEKYTGTTTGTAGSQEPGGGGGGGGLPVISPLSLPSLSLLSPLLTVSPGGLKQKNYIFIPILFEHLDIQNSEL